MLFYHIRGEKSIEFITFYFYGGSAIKVALENLDEIKNDRGHQDATPDLTGDSSLRRSVTYSISQIIPFVNGKDLLRYTMY